MSEWFINNRELIKSLSFNTGTSSAPTYTPVCTTSEITINPNFEEKDWFVFCDAIKRHLITGADIIFTTTIKLDLNNTAEVALLGKIHTLLKDGNIAQFNNETIEYELLESVANDVLTYKKYTAPCVLSFGDFAGAAEDEAEFSVEIKLTGKSTEVSP